MKATLLLYLLLTIACFGQGNYLPEPISPTAENARTTTRTDGFMRDEWLSSGYYRVVEDAVLAYPVYVAFTSNNLACIIDSKVWTLWKDQDVVQCSTKWRERR